MLQISRSDRRALSMTGAMLPAQQGAPQLWAIQPDGPLSRVHYQCGNVCVCMLKGVRVPQVTDTMRVIMCVDTGSARDSDFI